MDRHALCAEAQLDMAGTGILQSCTRLNSTILELRQALPVLLCGWTGLEIFRCDAEPLGTFSAQQFIQEIYHIRQNCANSPLLTALDRARDVEQRLQGRPRTAGGPILPYACSGRGHLHHPLPPTTCRGSAKTATRRISCRGPVHHHHLCNFVSLVRLSCDGGGR